MSILILWNILIRVSIRWNWNEAEIRESSRQTLMKELVLSSFEK